MKVIALILAVVAAFILFRYEITPSTNGGAWRLDRWDGEYTFIDEPITRTQRKAKPIPELCNKTSAEMTDEEALRWIMFCDR